MANPPIAFVAYSSRNTAIEQLIGNAVHVANGKNDRVRYESWVYNDVPGNPLISPIIDRIEESAFIIADITTLNLNVVYEIKVAIELNNRSNQIFFQYANIFHMLLINVVRKWNQGMRRTRLERFPPVVVSSDGCYQAVDFRQNRPVDRFVLHAFADEVSEKASRNCKQWDDDAKYV